jgi:uncharacterized protein (TIGR03435 family)
MKRLLLWLIVFAAVSGGLLHAQDIAGTWQGTLTAPGGGPALRIVVEVSKADDQSLKVVVRSIDQGGQPINAGMVTLQGSTFKFTVPAIGGNYEGRISDGNTISGSWTQGGAPGPLNLARATPATAWAIPEPPPPPTPMAANANLAFEVATIKPSNPEVRGQSLLVNRSGLFTTTNSTLNDLISFAWDLHVRQIVNGPSWLESERFDVTAKPEQPGIPNAAQLRTMVQKLIGERFGLAFHKEKRNLSAYVITVVKSGHKLAKNDSGGILPGFGGRGPGAIGVRNSTMTEFASFLQARILDRPVVDQTGLSGKFDFQLEWRPEPLGGQAGGPPPPLSPAVEARPDMFTAFQEQIGLKLESTTAPVEVYVIDKVQKPTEN